MSSAYHSYSNGGDIQANGVSLRGANLPGALIQGGDGGLLVLIIINNKIIVLIIIPLTKPATSSSVAGVSPIPTTSANNNNKIIILNILPLTKRRHLLLRRTLGEGLRVKGSG